MLKDKNNFEIINSFFYCKAKNFSEHPRMFMNYISSCLLQLFTI
jgi:hypothetical protein